MIACGRGHPSHIFLNHITVLNAAVKLGLPVSTWEQPAVPISKKGEGGEGQFLQGPNKVYYLPTPLCYHAAINYLGFTSNTAYRLFRSSGSNLLQVCGWTYSFNSNSSVTINSYWYSQPSQPMLAPGNYIKLQRPERLGHTQVLIAFKVWGNHEIVG